MRIRPTGKLQPFSNVSISKTVQTTTQISWSNMANASIPTYIIFPAPKSLSVIRMLGMIAMRWVARIAFMLFSCGRATKKRIAVPQTWRVSKMKTMKNSQTSRKLKTENFIVYLLNLIKKLNVIYKNE